MSKARKLSPQRWQGLAKVFESDGFVRNRYGR